jgi:hypothetical protein
MFVTILFFFPIFFSSPAHSEAISGLTQDVYTYSEGATPDRKEYTLCNTDTVSNINFDVGGDIVANCQQDFVLIHWYGYITMPVDGEIVFQSFADDGFYFEVNGDAVIDDWTLKGCSGNSGTHTFESGISQKVDIWWYEYGGGACNYLYYTDPVTAFTLIPNTVWTTEAQIIIVPPVVIDPPIIVDPPAIVDPPVEPPVVDPPIIEPPVVDPIIPDPPIVEPVIPEPPVIPVEPSKPFVEIPIEIPVVEETLATLTNIAPSEMTNAQIEKLQEAAFAILESSEQGSPEYEKALDALFIAAQADDIVVDEELANVPVVGAAVVALADAINFLGNIGADISPKVREESKKIVVGAVIAGQIAQVAGATSMSTIKRNGK